MGSSPDVGGRYGMGRPLQPDYRELESTAQTQVAKQGLAIVPNTLEIPLTQLGGNVWKYESNPSKPSLPQTVLAGISYPDRPQVNEKEQEKMQQLIAKLPLRLRIGFKGDRRKPYHLRDPRFIILERLMQFVAKAVIWFEEIAVIDHATMEEFTQKNRIYPSFTLKEWSNETRAIVEVYKKQSLQGAAKENIRILESLLGTFKAYEEAQKEKKERALNTLLNEAHTLNRQIEQKKFEEVARLTGHAVYQCITIASALSYDNAAPGLFALGLATLPIARETYSKSLFGLSFQALFATIFKINEEMPAKQKHYVKLGICTTALLFSTMVFLASGYTGKKNTDPRLEKEHMQSLAVKLAACLIAESGIIEKMSMEFLNVLQISKSEIGPWSAFSEWLAINTLIMAGIQGNPLLKTTSPLFEGMKRTIEKKLEILKATFTEVKGIPLINEINIAIRQALLAMKQRNAAGYFDAIKKMGSQTRIKILNMQEESQTVVKLSQHMILACNESSEKGNFMSVVSQAA